MPTLPPLPIDPYRPRISELLRESPVFLLEAPPGTGKSTRVPLWALDALPGRVLLLEPRRAAARMLAAILQTLLAGRWEASSASPCARKRESAGQPDSWW